MVSVRVELTTEGIKMAVELSEKEVEGKLAEYQKALDAAGYQDVLKEAQTQYDAWKASNK